MKNRRTPATTNAGKGSPVGLKMLDFDQFYYWSSLLVKIIPGYRDDLEKQLINAVFEGDTEQLKTIHQRLSRRAKLTVIGTSDPSPNGPVSPHQSDVEPV